LYEEYLIHLQALSVDKHETKKNIFAKPNNDSKGFAMNLILSTYLYVEDLLKKKD